MPSNKNKEKLERTGKNEIIHPAVSIVPVLERGVIVYKIIKITFTMSGQCVSIETVATALSEFEALVKFNSVQLDTFNIYQMRDVAQELTDDKEAKKASKKLKDEKDEKETDV